MNVDLRRTSHVIFFAALLPAVSVYIGWLFTQIFPHWPFWVDGISPLTAYALLFNFFDKVAWRWPIFRLLKIVTVPDLRGRWEGTQISSYVAEGKHVTSHVVTEVTQTFSGIQIATYYKRWSSKASVAQFVTIDDIPTLLIMFEAARKVAYEEADGNFLRGACELQLTADGQLEGSYFNGAGRHGAVVYKREGYILTHRFDDANSKPKLI
jgi:hypothetical protein